MSATEFVHYIRGIPVPNVPWFPKKNKADALDYVPRDSDIIIATYPKTGSSWLQFIVQQILSRGESLPEFKDLYYKIIPFFEMAGLGAIEALAEPRIFKHNFAYTAVQKNPKTKYLYIHRNPEDVFVSYYHFYRELVGENTDMDQFLDDFLDGKVWFGNYCDHVLSYLRQVNSDRILTVSYENLIANRKKEILRIAEFLGEEHYNDLLKDDAIVDRIVEHTELEYMKKNVAMMRPEMPKKGGPSEIKYRKVNYFRKGTVGDGKKTLSDEQLKRIREHVANKMGDTPMAQEWLSEE